MKTIEDLVRALQAGALLEMKKGGKAFILPPGESGSTPVSQDLALQLLCEGTLKPYASRKSSMIYAWGR